MPRAARDCSEELNSCAETTRETGMAVDSVSETEPICEPAEPLFVPSLGCRAARTRRPHPSRVTRPIMSVDGFRFLDGATRRVMRAWLDREPVPESVPWAPLEKPLAEARVALISSAGISRLDDTPFDQERERRNPWWGDPTHRVLPRDVATDEVGTGSTRWSVSFSGWRRAPRESESRRLNRVTSCRVERTASPRAGRRV